jgi:hypothetical protein
MPRIQLSRYPTIIIAFIVPKTLLPCLGHLRTQCKVWLALTASIETGKRKAELAVNPNTGDCHGLACGVFIAISAVASCKQWVRGEGILRELMLC